MAVAVKNSTEAQARASFDVGPLTSLLGALYVLGSFAVVFYGVPALWTTTLGGPISATLGSFFSGALKLVAMLAAAAGLSVLGGRLLGSHPAPGVRGGIFFWIAGIFAAIVLSQFVSAILASNESTAAVAPWSIVAGIGLLLGLTRVPFSRGGQKMLVQFEEQGWLTTAPYKKTQGLKVRRATLLGILTIVGCGIYSLLNHHTLEFGLPDRNNWVLWLPGGTGLILLPDVRFTVPILLTLGSLWFAYRVVNYPAFADFLIATEAEINKVSWTTRRKLVQDTIVVLTTVVLMTAFIFFVDIAWGWGLSKIGVLQVPDAKEKQKLEKTDW